MTEVTYREYTKDGKIYREGSDGSLWVWEGLDPGGETKWGISKRAHPELDIYNLTREQAIEIYRVEYWKASGADKMTWPLCLVHFDAAVNSGVGSAQRWLKESNGNPVLYLAQRLRAYTELGIWKRFGAGWSRRICDLMEVVARREDGESHDETDGAFGVNSLDCGKGEER